MKTIQLRRRHALTLFFAFSLVFTFTSCSKDDSTTGGSGSTTIKVTDAPIDDASVSNAFFTIADIQLDGVSVQGFSKTTVDIKAFQNGNTQTLGNFNLAGKTYNTITFVLDYDHDASGNMPGCYVVDGGVKHKFETTTNSITINKSISISGNASNSIVADFDLRKMIVYASGAAKYKLATSAELASSIRVVAEKNTSTIFGQLEDNVSASEKVVVYAYKKGTFNRTTEMQGQGSSNIKFKNAVSSALVTSGSGNYQLHYLEAGQDYELHFVSYKDTNHDGEMEVQGTLVVSTIGEIDILNLKLNANATLEVDAVVTAVFP